MATTCLYLRIPASVITFLGNVTGKANTAALVKDLMRLASNPSHAYKRSVLVWAASYAHPALLKRIIKSLVEVTNTNDWILEIGKRANPDLLLPREHVTPDFQMMSVSRSTPKSVLICVTGNALRLNMPIHVFHLAAADRFDVLIYLRDPGKQQYIAGIQGLGRTVDELVESLRAYIPPRCRISVLGTSGGGIAAARIANGLHASRLMLFSPPLSFKGVMAVEDGGLDNVGSAKLFFAQHNSRDARLAKDWQATRAALAIEFVDSDSHGTLSHLASRGRLDSLIDWLAMAAGPAVRKPPLVWVEGNSDSVLTLSSQDDHGPLCKSPEYR